MASFKVEPPKTLRPIFVQYVAVRLCRYNPSYARVREAKNIEGLWDAWEARHPRRTLPDQSVNLPPQPKKRKAKR